MITNKQRRLLAEQISNLSSTEHLEIYKILKYPNGMGNVNDQQEEEDKKQFEYMRNKNGIFFNLTDISENMFNKVQDFVTFCIRNNKRLDDYDQEMYERKMFHNKNVNTSQDLSTMPSIDTKQPLSTCLDGNNEQEEVAWMSSMLSKAKNTDKLAKYIDRVLKNQEGLFNVEGDEECVSKRANQSVIFANARKRYAKKWTVASSRSTKDVVLEPE